MPLGEGKEEMKPQPLRILVAEHDSASRKALQERLVDAGHRVCATGSGEDVTLLCELDPPDVLLLDLELPDMEGFEVCERVRHACGERQPTIIVMADALDDMTHTYLGQMVDYAGGDFYFAKPCDGNLVAALLSNLTTNESVHSARSFMVHPTNVTWPTRRSFASARCN